MAEIIIQDIDWLLNITNALIPNGNKNMKNSIDIKTKINKIITIMI